MFAVLGVRVILVEKRPRLLEFADSEIVEALSYHLRDSRVTMRLNEEVDVVEDTPGARRGNVEEQERITGDALLYAVGRQGNVEELNLPAAGIKADDRGRIKVDADFRTSQPNVFAVGDVIGFPSGFRYRWNRVALQRESIRCALAVEAGVLSVRDLHDSGDFVHRQDRRATDDEDDALRSGCRLLPEIARGANSR